jgi:hypothetical protein
MISQVVTIQMILCSSLRRKLSVGMISVFKAIPSLVMVNSFYSTSKLTGMMTLIIATDQAPKVAQQNRMKQDKFSKKSTAWS